MASFSYVDADSGISIDVSHILAVHHIQVPFVFFQIITNLQQGNFIFFAHLLWRVIFKILKLGEKTIRRYCLLLFLTVSFFYWHNFNNNKNIIIYFLYKNSSDIFFSFSGNPKYIDNIIQGYPVFYYIHRAIHCLPPDPIFRAQKLNKKKENFRI